MCVHTGGLHGSGNTAIGNMRTYVPLGIEPFVGQYEWCMTVCTVLDESISTKYQARIVGAGQGVHGYSDQPLVAPTLA